jgi:hypothetical protein
VFAPVSQSEPAPTFETLPAPLMMPLRTVDPLPPISNALPAVAMLPETVSVPAPELIHD